MSPVFVFYRIDNDGSALFCLRHEGDDTWASYRNKLLTTGPVFCLLLGVSSDYAQAITGQVTEVTCPVIGRAQPELVPSNRQKTGSKLFLQHLYLSSNKETSNLHIGAICGGNPPVTGGSPSQRDSNAEIITTS